MRKHKIGKVTRNTPHLLIVILSDEAVKMIFLLLCLDRYLFSVLPLGRYLLPLTKENVLSTTITLNVTMCR